MYRSSLSSSAYVLSETGPKQAQNSESRGKKEEGARNQRQSQQRLPLRRKLPCRQAGRCSQWVGGSLRRSSIWAKSLHMDRREEGKSSYLAFSHRFLVGQSSNSFPSPWGPLRKPDSIPCHDLWCFLSVHVTRCGWDALCLHL